ncbi:MAG TPA: mechanosensitive ion channel family protein, partial [Geminicoccaceae bacterium]|nr:mechanosensitive ion channel family protein [Geminicoccaceae bacterium]
HQAIAARLAQGREFLDQLVDGLPRVPAELARAWLILYLEFSDRGLVSVLLLILAFVGLGTGFEWLFHRATSGFRGRIVAAPLETVDERLRAVGQRLAYGLGMVGAFALGSVGAFLLFHWPPLLQEIVLGYLTVVLLARLALVAGRFLLAPGNERFRVLPMSTEAAWFWMIWVAILVGYFTFVRVTLDLLATLGVAVSARASLAILGGLVLLGLGLYVVWRHPPAEPAAAARPRGRIGRWLLSLYLVLVWLALLVGATRLFFVGILLLLLPIAIRATNRAVNNLLRPSGSEPTGEVTPSLTAVSLERGLRALLLIGGAYLIGWTMGLDLGEITMRDTPAARVLAGLINAVVVVLVADFLWHLLRAWIDRKLVEARPDPGHPDTDEARRRSRIRTLLPIFRNILLVTLVVMAALTGLASLGVEIGPLIAGAGVVGVAIGFGAQTLVKDIISGMFYLLDDAFRVGEYIQSGSYKGTVESFSLRSVKLRHHRGPLYTVPFGELGAVQNMSRDWVIDKLSVGITYDSDLDKVKKVIKKVSAELMADPELAPHFIEPLKMQGVDAFGDFAIQVRMKMMTKPGEQFVIRRRAYALIKKAFTANDIHFAFPTVTVAGGEVGEATPAIAKQALDVMERKVAAAS